LEKVLDYSALKQKVIGKNIANATTVGYKREDVEFVNVFDEANNKLKVDNARHIKSGDKVITPESELVVVQDKDTEKVSGFNNVDIDKEMAELAENNVMFKFAARRMNMYFRDLQAVIKGGR
jgi:flagellar basal-body rod protein FlgB